MLRGGTVITLHEMKAMGKSIRAIARETGHSRNTIRKYLRNRQLPQLKSSTGRPSKLDPFKPFLQECFADGIYNCEVLIRLLREKGYDGGRTILKDYVRGYRPPRQAQAVQRYETKPGEYAQVDWGLCDYVDLNGEKRKVAVFVMVLAYSRATYIEFTKRCDIHSFLRCLIHAFEYFNGIPRVMLTDHMKTVILGMGDDKKPRWHPLFEDFAASIGLLTKVCRVRRPQTKGKVERAVRFVKENFIPGRKFVDIGDLNRQAIVWCEEANRRVHGTTGERPCDRLPGEELQSLPSDDRWAKYRREVRRVSRDGFVSYDGVRYGVPWQYSGREVTVRDCNGWIEVWVENLQVARHEAVHRSRTIVNCPKQYAGLSTANGKTYPQPAAKQISPEQVEVRSLDVYEKLLEVGA
jgi:transposase